MEDTEHVGLLQKSLTVQAQPQKVRQDFVKKVLLLVALQMLVAVVSAAPLLFKHRAFLKRLLFDCECAGRLINGIFTANWVVLFVHVFFASGSLPWGRDTYMRMLSTPPWNLAFMLLYAVLSGLNIGFCSWLFPPTTLAILSASFLAAVVVVSFFSIRMSCDLSQNDSSKIFRLLVFATIVIYVVHAPKIADRVLMWCWGVFFLNQMTQHTQLIFGSVRAQKQFLEYTIDMFGYAAFVLYMLYINMFACSLKAFTP